jgi:methylglutamate dehydrogenase subunit D
MAEAITALAGMPASTASGRVALREVAAGTILRIQAWPETFDAFKRVAGDVLGMEAPPIGHAAIKGDVILAAIAPGTFVIAGLADNVAWLVREALPITDAAVTDWSHARACLGLTGEAAETVLQKCVAIDLSALPSGRAAATMIHHIDVLIVRLSATEFRLFALRSFAEALAEWVLDAGLEEGIGFRK